MKHFETRKAEMHPTKAAANHSFKYLPLSIEMAVERTPCICPLFWFCTMEDAKVIQSASQGPFFRI
jgi:hypothetical protein